MRIIRNVMAVAAATVMLLAGGAAVTATAQTPAQAEPAADATFTPPTSINRNGAWTSGNGDTTLRLQEDGHLVLYYKGEPQWSYAGTWDRGHQAVFQTDGNFVVYDESGTTVFNGDDECIKSGQRPIWDQATSMRLTDNGKHQFLDRNGEVLCQFPPPSR
ncbi:hypothetical protein [Streptomyces sp. 6N223]|uniref:hypothetical protein n=1 Tax=Streptomyces sp. 6N223 TaxID=3457412 RepID=UPI003FD68200